VGRKALDSDCCVRSTEECGHGIRRHVLISDDSLLPIQLVFPHSWEAYGKFGRVASPRIELRIRLPGRGYLPSGFGLRLTHSLPDSIAGYSSPDRPTLYTPGRVKPLGKSLTSLRARTSLISSTGSGPYPDPPRELQEDPSIFLFTSNGMSPTSKSDSQTKILQKGPAPSCSQSVVVCDTIAIGLYKK
jgi:hypothetical protein